MPRGLWYCALIVASGHLIALTSVKVPGSDVVSTHGARARTLVTRSVVSPQATRTSPFRDPSLPEVRPDRQRVHAPAGKRSPFAEPHVAAASPPEGAARRDGQPNGEPPADASAEPPSDAAWTELLPPAAESDGYVTRQHLSRTPQAESVVPLDYPSFDGDEGFYVAVLSLFIDEAGVVQRIRIEDPGLPEPLEGAARRAFLGVRFRPGEIDGRSVRSVIRVEVCFDRRPAGSE